MALRRSTSQVESIASSLIKKLEQLAKEREEEAEIAEKDGYDETIGTQSITWDEYWLANIDSPINSSTSLESLVDEVTVL